MPNVTYWWHQRGLFFLCYNGCMRQYTLDQIKEQILPILKEAGVTRSSLFGSYARGENGEDSDIDILIEFPAGKTLFDLVDLENDLKKVLQKEVDVVTYKSVSPYLRKRIFAEQVPLI